MISDKLYSADKTLELEEELKNNNYVIWKCNGVSMLPFIKAESDILILETIKSEPKPYDVLMYIRNLPDTFEGKHIQKYVLHRLLYKDGSTYVILGDNCITLEHIPEDKVVAIMTGIIRNGRKIDIDTLWYKLYMQLWVKPWKFRINVIKTKLKVKGILKKIKKKL